jgi:hypothetical protein
MSGVRLLFLTSLLIALTGVIAHSASGSLPGDALFTLKMDLENVHVRLADSPDVRARLHLHFAGRRVSEFRSLLVRGRYADLALASGEFARNIEQASSEAAALSYMDPARGSALSSEVLVVLREYSLLLRQNIVNIPGDLKPVVERFEVDSQPSSNGRNDVDVSPGVPTPLPTMTPILLIFSTSTPVSPVADPPIE